MERVVDLETDNLFVSALRGFFVVKSNNEERGRIPLDDIGAVIVHAHGITWSNTVFVRFAERAIPVVLCGPNHAPVSIVWPVQGFHLQGARMRAQIAAPKPLQKQLWQQIVRAKIRMQGQILELNGRPSGAFDRLARTVRSGDPGNVEAQAARRYWKAMFGSGFTRDRKQDGINGLLNYGYTVLRATVSRAICAGGLHPTLGLFHTNRANAFALADDLMEPYRPLVDHFVAELTAAGCEQVDTDAKKALGGIGRIDLAQAGQTSPLSLHVQRLVHSLANSFECRKPELTLPGRLVVSAPEKA